MKNALSTFALIVTVNLTSCRTLAPVLTSNQQSQITNQQLRIDSVYCYEKDSMSISMRAGAHTGSDPTCYPARTDTINCPARVDTMVIERWHTRWRDHEVVKTDTVYQTQTITQTQTQTITAKTIPRFYKWCTALFWMLVILAIGYLIFRIMKAVYLRK